MKSICVLGLGYMGLPMASILATKKYSVTGVDVNEEKLAKLGRGELTIEEPGLLEVFKSALQSGHLTFSSKPVPSDVFIIAVPTPFLASVRTADLTYVRLAAQSLVGVIKKGDIIILESTVPPATCSKIIAPILEETGLVHDKDFFVIHCPERAFPGNTMHEIVHNDRIIGGVNKAAVAKVKELYSSFVKGEIFLTSDETAEMVKLMENTYRDVNIALANELAKIAEDTHINIWEAIALANKHPRVNIHQPGPGVGGHCIAIDPWFLTSISKVSNIIQTARFINDEMPAHVCRIIESTMPADGKVVTILGVAYKPNVDDARETPAAHLIEILNQKGYVVRAHDYHVTDKEFNLVPLEEAISGSDCLVLVTHHDEYKKLDPADVAKMMRYPNLVDTRNHFDHAAWENAGFTVTLLGDGTPHA